MILNDEGQALTVARVLVTVEYTDGTATEFETGPGREFTSELIEADPEPLPHWGDRYVLPRIKYEELRFTLTDPLMHRSSHLGRDAICTARRIPKK